MITPIAAKTASLVGFLVSLFFSVRLDVAAAFSQAPSTASCCHHNFSYPLRNSLEIGPSSRSQFSSVIQILALRRGSQSLCQLDASAVKVSLPFPTSSHLKLLLGPISAHHRRPPTHSRSSAQFTGLSRSGVRPCPPAPAWQEWGHNVW